MPTFVCVVLYCGSNFQLSICRYVDYEAPYINLILSVLHNPQATYFKELCNILLQYLFQLLHKES